MKHNRDKRQTSAHKIVQRLLREGKLKKQPCEVCGSEGVVAHHDDYTQPDKIRWFCRKHHGAHHRALGWGTAGAKPSILPGTIVPTDDEQEIAHNPSRIF